MGRIQIPWTGLPRKESMRKLQVALVIVASVLVYLWLQEVTKSPAVCKIPVVTAQSGDDIWGLAEKYCEGEMREIVDKIISLNANAKLGFGKSTSDPGAATVLIYPGQVILLPTK